MSQPLYSVGTWDTNEQAYTPQAGLSVPSFNIDLWTLKRALKELKEFGYECHRIRSEDGEHEDNDFNVLVERTDGKSETDIMKGWER
jgi:hypothetical protein